MMGSSGLFERIKKRFKLSSRHGSYELGPAEEEVTTPITTSSREETVASDRILMTGYDCVSSGTGGVRPVSLPPVIDEDYPVPPPPYVKQKTGMSKFHVISSKSNKRYCINPGKPSKHKTKDKAGSQDDSAGEMNIESNLRSTSDPMISAVCNDLHYPCKQNGIVENGTGISDNMDKAVNTHSKKDGHFGANGQVHTYTNVREMEKARLLGAQKSGGNQHVRTRRNVQDPLPPIHDCTDKPESDRTDSGISDVGEKQTVTDNRDEDLKYPMHNTDLEDVIDLEPGYQCLDELFAKQKNTSENKGAPVGSLITGESGIGSSTVAASNSVCVAAERPPALETHDHKLLVKLDGQGTCKDTVPEMKPCSVAGSLVCGSLEWCNTEGWRGSKDSGVGSPTRLGTSPDESGHISNLNSNTSSIFSESECLTNDTTACRAKARVNDTEESSTEILDCDRAHKDSKQNEDKQVAFINGETDLYAIPNKKKSPSKELLLQCPVSEEVDAVQVSSNGVDVSVDKDVCDTKEEIVTVYENEVIKTCIPRKSTVADNDGNEVPAIAVRNPETDVSGGAVTITTEKNLEENPETIISEQSMSESSVTALTEINESENPNVVITENTEAVVSEKDITSYSIAVLDDKSDLVALPSGDEEEEQNEENSQREVSNCEEDEDSDFEVPPPPIPVRNYHDGSIRESFHPWMKRSESQTSEEDSSVNDMSDVCTANTTKKGPENETDNKCAKDCTESEANTVSANDNTDGAAAVVMRPRRPRNSFDNEAIHMSMDEVWERHLRSLRCERDSMDFSFLDGTSRDWIVNEDMKLAITPPEIPKRPASISRACMLSAAKDTKTCKRGSLKERLKVGALFANKKIDKENKKHLDQIQRRRLPAPPPGAQEEEAAAATTAVTTGSTTAQPSTSNSAHGDNCNCMLLQNPHQISLDTEPPLIGDFIGSLRRLKDCGWYWGPLSWDDANAMLANKPDGSFLVRDSSDERYILSLSFKSQGSSHHTRIEHYKGMFSFFSQPKSHGCGTIVEFVEKAMEHSRNGKFLYFLRPRAPGSPPVPVQLLHPISRFISMQSLQHMCRFVILKNVRYDHIEQLPLPTRIKLYLKEAQYYTEAVEEEPPPANQNEEDTELSQL